jgi:predicted dehydrogenase
VNSKIKVAVVGLSAGQNHIQGYLSLPDQFEIYAICDIDESKARAVAEKYNILRYYKDIHDLYDKKELDVIDICTPSHLHTPQVKEVLAAGKHAVCEKPIGGSLREVDEIIEAEKKSGKRVMPIFQYRFGHGIQKLKMLKDEGVTGKTYVTTVETHWRRKTEYYAVPWRGKWKTELGGPLVTLSIHAQDMLYYILGPVKKVYARAVTRVNPIETEDCIAASLEMSDGSLASLSVTTGSAAQISRHRFCFSNLTAESSLQPYNNGAEPWTFTPDTPEDGKRIEEVLARFNPLPERYIGQMYRFAQALKNDEPFPVTLADARASIELITALYESIQTGKSVSLPIKKNHKKYNGWQPEEE